MEAERSIAYGTVQAARPQKKSKHGLAFKIVFLVLVLIVGICGAMIGILRSNKYQFKEVRVFDTATFSKDDIIAFTHTYWSGNYVGAVPRTNTVLFSKDDFEKQLRKKFPVIEMAYVTLPEPDILEIHIQERKPIVTWCFADNTCGFVDEKGILYARAPQFSDGVYPIFQSQLNDPTYKKFGTMVIEPSIMNRFADLFKHLQSDDIELSKVMFYEDGDVGFSIDKLFGLYTRNDARLLGTFGQDDEIFVRDMLTGLGNDAFKKQFIANPKDLEYIDMRFPGKIFYKFSSRSVPLENKTDN
jgi:hypothetical protein